MNKPALKKEHQEIIDLIVEYLSLNPDQRFGQAIFNLDINQFVDHSEPSQGPLRLRDIYEDSNEEINERIKKRVEWFESQGGNQD